MNNLAINTKKKYTKLNRVDYKIRTVRKARK